jgi:hypothetical protein
VVLIASGTYRHQGQLTGGQAAVLSSREVLPIDRSSASGANFPGWKSRFARSSGYDPARDGRFAPPLAAAKKRRSGK